MPISFYVSAYWDQTLFVRLFFFLWNINGWWRFHHFWKKNEGLASVKKWRFSFRKAEIIQMSSFSLAYTPKKQFDLQSYSYCPFSIGKLMWWWWFDGSLLKTCHLFHWSVWGEVVDNVQIWKWHNIAQILSPTLTDSDDVLLSDEDFPILLLSFVDFFCTHFQSLRTVVRIHLVYITTFSRLNMSPNPTPHICGPVRLNCVHQLSVY